MSLYDRNFVTLRTNRVEYTLYRKIIDLLNEESVSGAHSGRASLYIRQEDLLRMFEKVTIAKVRFKKKVGPQTYTHM